jgi:serine/threonine protein kinase
LAVRNVLLSKDGTPKLSDFGMSRQLQDDEGQTNTAIGPIAWMAPEAVNRLYSSKSDVWSFGCLIYEIGSFLSVENFLQNRALTKNEATVTGHVPHAEIKDKLGLALRIREGYHPAIPEDAPEELKKVMENCWKMQPEDRPTFASVLTFLKEAIRKRKSVGEEIEISSDDEEDAEAATEYHQSMWSMLK